MAKARNQIENIERQMTTGAKKFVRYEEGAQLFSMGLHSFEDLAKEAGAVYHYRRVALINVEKVNAYLENFCDAAYN